jgi:hypothetical protein
VTDPGAARKLLRSGVFAGLRDNVRSLGEYASERSGTDAGRQLVKGFFSELEAFDAALRQVGAGGSACGGLWMLWLMSMLPVPHGRAVVCLWRLDPSYQACMHAWLHG